MPFVFDLYLIKADMLALGGVVGGLKHRRFFGIAMIIVIGVLDDIAIGSKNGDRFLLFSSRHKS